ncbi:VanZ family protein [Amycolatopsis nigrescens]|uniref:VanZ family protein n=1 Tax=Amycolatopsis nigrescens TaxID=381445 RepID=UPI0004777F87|nr:VanZ family protein [Amycolatopsis nigrescens]
MTTAQVTALGYGLLGFFAIWATVLVPQLIVQQARLGRVDPRRLAGTAAVILYGCLALAVVLLPLPGPNSRQLEQTIQLNPFQWVTDIGTELHKHELSPTIEHALTSQTFQQLAMNVLLFVPIGLFARTMWRRGIVGAGLIGFAVSLAVEITQVTANFGTAPFVYRIFDVDDLISNTGGALLGWVAAALFLALRRNNNRSAVDVQPAGSGHVDFAESR